MKKCSSCGNEFENGEFCPECGAKYVEKVETENANNDTPAFCPNCGTKMNEGSIFCSNCGWSKNGVNNAKGKLNIPKVNIPKVKNPLVFAIPVAIIAAIFVIKTLFFGGIGKGAEAIVNSTNNSILAVSKNEVVDLAANVFSKGSVEINVEKMPNIEGLNIPVEANGKVKMYFDQNKFATTFDGKIAGVECNDNILYFDDSKFVAKSSIAFGSKTYGVNIKNLKDSWVMDLLRNTDKSTYNLINDALDKNIKIDTNALTKDITKIYMDFVKEFKKTAKKNLKFKNENDEVFVGDKELKVLKVSTDISETNAATMAKDILKWAKSYSGIKNFVKKYHIYVQNMLSFTNYKYRENDYSETELYEEIIKLIDEAISEFDELNPSDETEVNLKFQIAKNTKQLVKMSMSSGSDNIFDFTIGSDWKNPNIISLKVEGMDVCSYTSEKEGSDITYNINALGLRELGTIKINWNDKSGDFTIKNSNNDIELNCSGNMKLGDKTIITFDRIRAGDGYSSVNIKPNTTFTLKKKDGVPNAPGKFEDILNMTQSEAVNLGTEILDRVGDKFNLGNISNYLY